MIKVYLLSTFRKPEEDAHWASPYFALKKAFEGQHSNTWQLVDEPETADLVVICPRSRNPVLPLEIFREGIAWKYRDKCVVVSTDDNPTLTHKGFYTCLRAGDNRSHWLKGGFYPLAAFEEPHDPFPVNGHFRYFFSFIGSFETHAIRRQIGALAGGVVADKARPFLIRDTSTRSLPSNDGAINDGRFKQDYLDALRDSKFILCPRGRCPSSVRLFETMKAARVPVVISDEWVPPPEIAWETFAIVIKEKDVPRIPHILGGEELSFSARATAARKAWEDYFSVDALPGTVVKWGMALVEEARLPIHRRTHLTQLLAQTVQWRFIRRGVASELRHLVARALH